MQFSFNLLDVVRDFVYINTAVPNHQFEVAVSTLFRRENSRLDCWTWIFRIGNLSVWISKCKSKFRSQCEFKCVDLNGQSECKSSKITDRVQQHFALLILLRVQHVVAVEWTRCTRRLERRSLKSIIELESIIQEHQRIESRWPWANSPFLTELNTDET